MGIFQQTSIHRRYIQTSNMAWVKFLVLLTISSTMGSLKVEEVVNINLPIVEKGTHLVQKIQVDKLKRQIIYDVPAHNGRIATRVIQDTKSGFTLQVEPVVSQCLIYKTSIRQEPEEVVEIAKSVPLEKNQHINVDNNSGMQSMVTIMGPRLSQEALKEFGFEGYCPKGHSLFAAHQRVESEGLLDNGTISFGANLERDLVEGDTIEGVEKDFFDFVPDHYRIEKIRRKRECRKLDWSVSSCHWVTGITCPQGCAQTDVVYRCQKAEVISNSCTYFMLCNTINQGTKCLAHVTNTDRKCQCCCQARDCGNLVPFCGA